MFNPFPELLDYRIFAATILRIAAAVVLVYAAYQAWRRRKSIASVRLPIIGGGEWVAYVSAAFHGVMAYLIGTGSYTQYAAIVGIVGALKGLLLSTRYPGLVHVSRATLFLLLAIFAALLFLGAGAFAFDRPL